MATGVRSPTHLQVFSDPRWAIGMIADWWLDAAAVARRSGGVLASSTHHPDTRVAGGSLTHDRAHPVCTRLEATFDRDGSETVDCGVSEWSDAELSGLNQIELDQIGLRQRKTERRRKREGGRESEGERERERGKESESERVWVGVGVRAKMSRRCHVPPPCPLTVRVVETLEEGKLIRAEQGGGGDGLHLLDGYVPVAYELAMRGSADFGCFGLRGFGTSLFLSIAFMEGKSGVWQGPGMVPGQAQEE